MHILRYVSGNGSQPRPNGSRDAPLAKTGHQAAVSPMDALRHGCASTPANPGTPRTAAAATPPLVAGWLPIGGHGLRWTGSGRPRARRLRIEVSGWRTAERDKCFPNATRRRLPDRAMRSSPAQVLGGYGALGSICKGEGNPGLGRSWTSEAPHIPQRVARAPVWPRPQRRVSRVSSAAPQDLACHTGRHPEATGGRAFNGGGMKDAVDG